LFFITLGFWNVAGSGLLGFSINTPIALNYMQGLNLTAAHGHSSLFGVYGMLGIGLMLFCLRGFSDRRVWPEKLLTPTF
jgi:nitric oxide reductase subunit B